MELSEKIKNLLLRQYERYPAMRVQDAVKLLYQSEFAGGHIIENEYESLKRLKVEFAPLEDEPQDNNEEAFEDIGGGLCRLNLRSLKALGPELETVNRFFVETANSVSGSIEAFEQKLGVFVQLCRTGDLPFAPDEAETFIAALKECGYAPVSHSAQYREAYRPAYRVVKSVYRNYLDVFRSIDVLLEKNESVSVAIDGNCGAGKSALALLVSGIYDCNVFHMDDFFLQPQQRTEERLNQQGGNVDYERFYDEVLMGIKRNRSFRYRKYECQNQQLGEAVAVTPKRLNIIEGSYSMHPKLIGFYSLKIFMQVGAHEQSDRILKRSGAELHERFLSEWIPMENRYFESLGIKEKCTLVFGDEE